MTTQAPASTVTLLAKYVAPSGQVIELRKNEHGYFTKAQHADGSATLIHVSRQQALEAYQYAVHDEGGVTWSWS